MNIISILMGLALSALLIASAMQGVMIAKKTFQAHRSQMHFLDTGQSAIRYFMRDVQAGGYRGCRSADPSFPLTKHYSDWNKAFGYFRQDRVVFGFIASPGTCYRKIPISACKRIKENSPVLIIYQVAQKINPLIQSMKKADDPLVLPMHHGIHNGALVLISDAYQGDMFIANRVQGPILFHEKILGFNNNGSLSKAYSTKAEVVELQTVAYYVGKPERFLHMNLNQPISNKTSFALFRDDYLQNAQEIIAGVTHVEFEYALQKTAGGNIQYYKSEDILEEHWPLVSSLRIHLTMENQKSWSFEIALRNRIIPYFNLSAIDSHFMDFYSYGNAKHAYLSKNETFFQGVKGTGNR